MKAEITEARRYFTAHKWPTIDVTQRSIEETAAAIMQHLTRHREAAAAAGEAAPSEAAAPIPAP